MSEFGGNLLNMVKKSFEAIGNKAGDIASSAKQKVDQFNLANQKNDLFAEIGRRIYDMAREGKDVPKGLDGELEKIAAIDLELDELRAEKKEEENAEDAGDPGKRAENTDVAPETPAAAEYAAKDNSDVPVIVIEEDEEEDKAEENCPLSSAINDLFEKMPPVDKMVDKVNSSLDELGDNLRRFSSEFDRQLNEFSDQMMGKDDSGKDPQE